MIDVPRDDVILMLEAGYMYLAMQRFAEAKKLFEGICELVPNHEVPLVALANSYFAQYKFLEAVRVLKKAVQANPKSAHAVAHLGEALLFNGKKDQAIEQLKLAMELDQNNPPLDHDFAKSLLELIAQGYDPVEFRKEAKKALKEQKKVERQGEATS